MNVCLVGYGMMGAWHSNALRAIDCDLHTVVGRRPEPTRAFADRYGYAKWTTSFDEALADGAVDAVIVAGPSELHAKFAEQALECGKHSLVEIPLAMTLGDATRLVEIAATNQRALGVVHPLRFRPEMIELSRRLEAGQEQVRHVGGRFFIYRVENVGATGYRRSWTDNLLWHHMAHLIDFGLWILGEESREVRGFMSPIDPKTGIPMDAYVAVETEDDHSLVCTGSYYGRERIFEAFVVTDRDSYRLEVFGSTLSTSAGTIAVDSEEGICALVTRDFIEAIREGRKPHCAGSDVIPTMRVLQEVQSSWDRRHGARPLPGRPLD